MKQNHEYLERQEVIEAYQKEGIEYDKLVEDCARQRKEIDNEIEKINVALSERGDKINEQLSILDIIRKEKNEYKQELERLHYRVKDLNKHIDKYRSEIERLGEEKE